MASLIGWMNAEHIWLFVGFVGQGLFASRFLVQWFKSEIEGRSVIPVAFWYFSLGGGVITLVYAIHVGKDAAPFIAGQAGGLIVYARNLYLIFKEKAAHKDAQHRAD
ncbi:MAG TPA: lipid-A-disaccharide synthase N-terminal domain-containing protein [Rhizomicrobium sp.]|nr:lipid-A-disaccharide synthase N-terminal domain-containing protein [Rhizomicrobium sp.]